MGECIQSGIGNSNFLQISPKTYNTSIHYIIWCQQNMNMEKLPYYKKKKKKKNTKEQDALPSRVFWLKGKKSCFTMVVFKIPWQTLIKKIWLNLK